MKKKLLFLMLSVLTLGAWADDVSSIESPTQIPDIRTYFGTDKFVYSKADKKVYAYNNLNRYEEYGLYQEVKLTSPDYVEVNYIATDASHQTYINTGYIHTANTRIVADVEMTDEGDGWQAVFGARQGSYSTKAFVMFSTSSHNGNHNGVFNRSGNEADFNENIPANTRIIIDASGQTATVKKQSDGSTIATATTSGTADAGSNAMFIFNTNTAGAGGVQPDGSYNKMKLYSFRIYEGDNLVHDYVPIVTSGGKGGLYDKVAKKQILSATSTDFVTSSTYATASAATSKGVSTYVGKLVVDGDFEYMWSGTAWVLQGCEITTDHSNYSGSADLVYDSEESKFYAKNDLGEYEEYGLFGNRTYTLKQAGDGPKDYLFTTGKAYFNTGYTPKSNTKVRATALVNPGTGEWQALYGCGFEDGSWQKRFAFFSRADGRGRACIQLTSQNDVRCGALFGRKAVYEVVGSTGVGTIYADDGTTVLETVTGTAQSQPCTTPMYILADNNTLPSAVTPNPRSYSNNTSLFRVEIYEGDTKVHDYIPYVYNGTAGLYDNKDGDMLSDFQSSKFLSPNGSGLTAGSVTAYEGKIVRLVPENQAYKYSNGEWTDQGPMTFTEISNTDYKDMRTWNTNSDHQSVFTGHITYEDGVNTFAYKGISGWEPLRTTVTVETGKEFRFSFKYENSSSVDAVGWEDGRLRVAIQTSIADNTNNYFHGWDPNHLLTYKHGIEVPVTMDFTPSQTSMMIGIQFGAVKDDINYTFKFNNLKVEKYVYPEAYDVIDITRATEYYEPVIIEGSDDYYFYNVGSELWLQDNNRNPSGWTTRAELGDRGMNVGVSAISGGYKLDPYFGNNHSLNGGEDQLYMDTGRSVTAWTISSVPGTDYVTIKSGDKFLGSDGSANKYLTVSSSLSGENAYWKMYTADEYYNVRKTEMLTATQASPKDATWMIKDPKFGNNDERESNWNKNWTGGNNDLQGDDGVMCNRVWESWNASSHSLTQTLEILPAGVYRMSVQGFYNSNSSNQLPYYFVENSTSGKVQDYFMLRSEGVHESTNGCQTTPGSQGAASKCIYEGHYQNPWIYFIVGSDNEATTIGVKKEGQKGEDWLVYDNFKLEYLGLDYEISFNENNTSIDEINRLATRITMTRSMQNDRWNTFCVPFAMTGSQITEQFGSDSQVKELSGAVQNGENYTMNFTNADAIVAGKPYMVKPANNVSSIELTNASGIAVNTTGTPSVTKDGVTFTGVYASGYAPLGSFIISNNNFYLVDTDTNSDGISEVALKAFRGYITVPAGVKALNFTFEDDDATAIEMVNGQSSMVNEIYNLAGQRISKMQKGVNIVNGKKILK